jgi:hypothetical protein
MEETVLKTLTERERALLSDLYDSESMKALRKALAQYQLEKAQWVLTSSPNHEYTIQNRGAVEGANFVFGLVRSANQKENKKSSR